MLFNDWWAVSFRGSSKKFILLNLLDEFGDTNKFNPCRAFCHFLQRV